MKSKFISKKFRRINREIRKYPIALVGIALLLVGLISYTSYIENRRLQVDPATYKSLLGLIAKAESNGNYNAFYGNASNKSLALTSMSITEVLAWQTQYVASGSPSSAVGKYQIIRSTLAELVDQLGLDGSIKFDKSTQDKLAIALIERRGAESYVNQEISRQQFAANLAKEWAALPRVIGGNPESSYYAGDGLNRSRVKVDALLKAIQPISPKNP